MFTNILVNTRGKERIQTLTDFISFSSKLRRYFLDTKRKQHSMTKFGRRVACKGFDPAKRSSHSVLYSLEEEALQRRKEEAIALARTTYPDINVISNCLTQAQRAYLAIIITVMYQQSPKANLLNKLLDRNTESKLKFLASNSTEEPGGLCAESQDLFKKIKKDGFIYRLLLVEKEKISDQLAQEEGNPAILKNLHNKTLSTLLDRTSGHGHVKIYGYKTSSL